MEDRDVRKKREENLEHAKLFAEQLAVSPVLALCDQALGIEQERPWWIAYPVEAAAAPRKQTTPDVAEPIRGPFRPHMQNAAYDQLGEAAKASLASKDGGDGVVPVDSAPARTA